MKKLLLKILLLAAIVIGISSVLANFLLPDFWPRPDAKAKLRYWEKNKTNYNAVFIGSSRMYHHIIPAEFDSLCRLEGKNVQSFNLGVPSFPFPQSHVMLDEVMENPVGLKYVFLEISPVYYESAEELVNTPEDYYWYDWQHMMLLCRQVKSMKQLEPSHKRKLYRQHVLGWVEKNLFAGGAQGVFSSLVSEEDEWVEEKCAETSGFSALDDELVKGPAVGGNKVRRKVFVNDTSQLAKRRKQAMNHAKERPPYGSQPYSEYLNELCQQLIAQGIQVYFVIQPRSTGYKGLNDLISQLPKDHVIDLTSPVEFPEFYSFRYAFDKGHMNHAGARIFTQRLFDLSLGSTRNQ